MVERCPRCHQTLAKDSKEEAYWCEHCAKYFSYEEIEES